MLTFKDVSVLCAVLYWKWGGEGKNKSSGYSYPQSSCYNTSHFLPVGMQTNLDIDYFSSRVSKQPWGNILTKKVPDKLEA